MRENDQIYVEYIHPFQGRLDATVSLEVIEILTKVEENNVINKTSVKLVLGLQIFL